MNDINTAIKALGLKVKEIHKVPESFSSTVNILTLHNGKKAVLKIPFSRSKLHREKRILEVLKGKLQVPELIGFWEGDDGHNGALLLSFLEGEPITGEIDLALAYKLGKLLAEIHLVAMDDYELVEGETDDWWGSIRIRFHEWVDECRGHLDDEFIENCILKFYELYNDLPEADGPRLVHYDYRPGNVLVKDDAITGLIDFESSRGGSTDVDFTKAKVYMWDVYPGTKEAFTRGYESVRELPDIDKTLPFYLFFNGFGGLAWCFRRDKLDDGFFKENYDQVMEFFNN